SRARQYASGQCEPAACSQGGGLSSRLVAVFAGITHVLRGHAGRPRGASYLLSVAATHGGQSSKARSLREWPRAALSSTFRDWIPVCDSYRINAPAVASETMPPPSAS